MTSPQINTLEYLRRALSNQQNSAVVTQNADNSLSISLDIGPGAAEIVLEPLQGPTGPPGLPQFPLMAMPDIYTDPKDLPFDLVNNEADIGKFWLITQSDANGVILSAAYIWFGTEYRVLPFGTQGPPGKYGVVKPYTELLEPDNLSQMTWLDTDDPVQTGIPPNAGSAVDPYKVNLKLSVPQGPMGESCPLFDMPDVSHVAPPLVGQFMAATGDTVTVDSDELPVWAPTSVGDIIPQPYIVPSSAFSSYSGVDFSSPVTVLTFPVPPCPFPFKPLVFGQIEMFSHKIFERLPSEIGVMVLLGDPDPEVGTLVARGFGNAARGVVVVMPHCSYPQNPTGSSVVWDSTGTTGIPNASHTGGTPVTYTHHVSSAADVTVELGISFVGTGSNPWSFFAPTSVTFGSHPMNFKGFCGNNNVTNATGFVALYSYSGIGLQGAQTVSVTAPTTGFWWAQSVAYTGVANVSSIHTNFGNSTNPTTGAITSAPGDMVVSILGEPGKVCSAPTQTQRFLQSGTTNYESGCIQDAPGAATVTSAMTAATGLWAAAAVNLSPDTTGPDSIAMTPWNDVAAIAANNTGGESTLYVILVNEGKKAGLRAKYDFDVAGSGLFVLACPMTDQDQLSPPLYGGLSTTIKLTGLIT